MKTNGLKTSKELAETIINGSVIITAENLSKQKSKLS